MALHIVIAFQFFMAFSKGVIISNFLFLVTFFVCTYYVFYYLCLFNCLFIICVFFLVVFDFLLSFFYAVRIFNSDIEFLSVVGQDGLSWG